MTTEAVRSSPLIRVGRDGIDIDLNVPNVGFAPKHGWVFSVGFAELNEVRTLSTVEAEAHLHAMLQSDASLSARMGAELSAFIAGQLPRPSLFQYQASGTHLLARGPAVLYVVGDADQTGPAAVAAWQAWQAAHAAQKG
jgi:hypothetical protein